MYKCECGCVFETHFTLEEENGEKFSVCPNCHSFETDYAYECAMCGEMTKCEEMSYDLCENCVLETVKGMQYFLMELLPQQLELLDNLIADGEITIYAPSIGLPDNLAVEQAMHDIFDKAEKEIPQELIDMEKYKND